MLGRITDSVIICLSRLYELVMDRDAWHVAIHGARKNWTELSEFTVLTIHTLVLSETKLVKNSLTHQMITLTDS